jgi:transcriptional antiterminator RfaH
MDDQGPTWYAVHTKPLKEPMVNDALKRQGFDTLFLHYGKVIKHARKTRRVIRSLFARYVFVGAVPGQALYDINSTIGVSTIVYLGDKPLKIPLPVIEELRARGNAKGRCKLPPELIEGYRRQFRLGEQVSVIDGPLAGLLAVISLDKGHEVRVWLDLFGGKVSALFAPEGLKSVSPVGGLVEIPRRHSH